MLLLPDIIDKIISSSYKVYNTPGYGFLEKVYENALIHEITTTGFNASSQFPIDVFYESKKLGVYFADIMVDSKIIVEVKATEAIAKEHELQLINLFKSCQH